MKFYDPGNYDGPSYSAGFEDGKAQALAEAAAAVAPAPQALDVLLQAIEREKRGTIRYPEDIGHDMGMAHAQDIIRREYARLSRLPSEEER